MMPLVYETIKAFKRRTTKPSASSLSDNDILLRDFGVDMMMAESKLLLQGVFSGAKNSRFPTDERTTFKSSSQDV